MEETAEFNALVDRFNQLVATLPDSIAIVAVNFSKDRFRAQNWVDHTTHPWKPRNPRPAWGKKRERPGRAILVKSGRLMRSIRVVSVSANQVVIGSDVPYARIHNEGFRGKAEQNVREHYRRAKRRNKKKTVKVSAHKRQININMPERRFMGASATLEQKLNRFVKAEFLKVIKQFNNS